MATLRKAFELVDMMVGKLACPPKSSTGSHTRLSQMLRSAIVQLKDDLEDAVGRVEINKADELF